MSTNSFPHYNPLVRLLKPRRNGCLQGLDKQHMATVVTLGRFYANQMSDRFPELSDLHSVLTVQETPGGMQKMCTMTAIMYTYWDAAPQGASLYDTAVENVPDPRLRAVIRQETFCWGVARIVPPLGEFFFVVEDTEHGSIVADPSMTKFYAVLGLEDTPLRALTLKGLRVPARARFTILPFRGVLLYDGMVIAPPTVQLFTLVERATLGRKYAAALRAGAVITGLNVERPDDDPPAPSMESVRDMPTNALREFVRSRHGTVRAARAALLSEARRVRANVVALKAVVSDPATEPVREGAPQPSDEEARLLQQLDALPKTGRSVCVRRPMHGERAFGAKEHLMVIVDEHSTLRSFTTARAAPTPTEVLRAVVRLGWREKCVGERFVVDRVELARRLNEMTRDVGVHVGFYPIPSIEEQALNKLV